MNKNIILHVSETNISPNSGMGRVEYYWKEAFERAGYIFMHIGPAEVGDSKHPSLFPNKAYRYYKKLKIKPRAFIVHEPAAGLFVNRGIPCFVESHGVERRYWEAQLNGSVPSTVNGPLSFKTKLLFPLWRLRGCDKGLKFADKLLLINSDDKDYVKRAFNRRDDDILMFRNGVNAVAGSDHTIIGQPFTVLFNGNWLERKGIKVLVDAASELYSRGLIIHYLLIGTGKHEETVLNDWPEWLRPFVTVIPRFAPEDEGDYLRSASLFVLPSYFEGQPLSLLQAMAAGRCSITTNCCGQKDIINDGETGFLFTIGDHLELADIINRCYGNPENIKEVGNKALDFVKNLTWENVSEEVVDFVLNNNSH